MIGLVIVTHGRLAEELRAAMEHVVGPQRNVAAVSVAADDDTEARRNDVRRAIEQVETGDGVILLTDMLGGTPSNLCIAQMSRPSVEVLAGVNLPMLVKLAKIRSVLPIGDAVACAQAAGRKYIASAADVLPHCRETPPMFLATEVPPLCQDTASARGRRAGRGSLDVVTALPRDHGG